MPPLTVDRAKTCPFLLQVFCKLGDYHSIDSFITSNASPRSDEVHIYAWPDSTLREIADIVRDTIDDAK